MTKISREDKITYSKTAAIIGLVIIVFLSWLWWTRVYMSKGNVFNAMLGNSLSTYGMTKTVKQDGQSGSFEQISQAQFGSQNLVESQTTIKQPTEAGDVKVVTQTLATPTENFVRYSSIDVPAAKDKKKVDFSPLTSVWGKTEKDKGGDGVFAEAAFGVVLFGNLPNTQRAELTKLMKDKAVYKVDYSKVESKKIDNKSVYVYPVEVNLQGYVELVKKYDELLGLKSTEQYKVEDYAGSQPLKLKLSIDKVGRSLVKIEYLDGGREETISGYGIHRNISLPNSDIKTREELEKKLQEFLAADQPA